jgi:peptidoglycan/xylan/chitin deacetylase (PgdA/CDA1 family)
VRAIALEYHDVVTGDEPYQSGFPGPGPASYKLTERNFISHLEAIRDSVGVSRVGRFSSDETNCPQPGVVFLTFDDGGASAYTTIADRLEQYGWRGHFFVTTNYVGTPGFLSISQIRELDARGHILGVHSASHPAMMGACSLEQMTEEWTNSVTTLSEILGHRVLVGSVPGGYYTKNVGLTASQAGIRGLFTSEPVTKSWIVDKCVVLGRYSIRKWTGPGVAASLASGSARARFSQWAFYKGLGMIRVIGGGQYLAARNWFWHLHGIWRR